MAQPLPVKDHGWEIRIYLERIFLVCAVLAMCTLLLVARYFYLQVLQHDIYATRSDNNRVKVHPLPPARGLIYDRHGELLADNLPSFNLTITPDRVDDLDLTLAQLKQIVGLSEAEIDAFHQRAQHRQRPYESVPVRFEITPEDMARISVDRFILPGIAVEPLLVRYYPRGELAAHAVGSVRRINEQDARELDRVAYSGTAHIGKLGIERFYEEALLGTVGYQQVEIDARGQIMKVLDATPPTPGRNLVLHLDASLQQAASDALGDRRGVVVAIEPATGGILALVSKPSYDPNLFVRGIDHETYDALRDSPDIPLFNRALQGQYEPGSTIKPFLGLAGLATKTIRPNDTIRDPGWFRLPGSKRIYRDWNWTKSGAGGHGVVDFSKAIYRSCNVYFYSLSVKLGIDDIHQYLASFGFGLNTVLDLPEARSGLVPSPAWKKNIRNEIWYPGDTVNVSIGQGDMLVTPLQLATAVAVIANRGKWVSPRLLKSGSEIFVRPSVALPDVSVIPQADWSVLIASMEEVVHRGNQGFEDNGTAWKYIGRDISYRMAGKSGTAQVVGIKQGEEYDEAELSERQKKHAWFVAFAPSDDPVIALAVLVENGGGGSSVAAPVARAVIDHYLVKDPVAPPVRTLSRRLSGAPEPADLGPAASQQESSR